MTSRELREVADTESPTQDQLETPQFSSNKDFFARHKEATLEDLLESPPQPMTFRPVRKQEQEARPLKIGDLHLDAETKGAIEELGLEVDDYVNQDEGDYEAALEIEKIRALAELAITRIRDKYNDLESQIFTKLSHDDQAMIEMTRPDCLRDSKPSDELGSGSIEGFEEIKSRWESDVRALRDEVERLRNRVADAEGGISFDANPHTKQKIVKLLQSELMVEGDMGEKCANLVLEAVDKDILFRENQLRKELELIFESEKEQIKEAYEEQMSRAVEETRTQVTEFWQGKAKKPRIDEMQKMREGVVIEVEAKLKAEYEEKLRKRMSQVAPRGRGEDMEMRERLKELEAYRANQEIEFELRLETEKESWKRELVSLNLDEHRKALELEFEQKLATRTQEIQEQSKTELMQLAAQFRSEAQEAISQHLQRISEETERKSESVKNMLREECLRDMRSEREMKLADALAARLSVQLEKDLRKDLAPKIEKELRLLHEEQLRAQLRKEFEEVYETRRQQLEQEMRHKIRNAQERVEGKFEEDVTRLLAEKTAKIEKELKIKYKTKLERVKKQTESVAQQDYEQKKEEELAELRKEKNEVARLKSALNIQLKKAATDRKEMLETIHRQELELERKTKELTHQLTRLQVQDALPSEPSKSSRLNPGSKPEPSSTRHRDSRISPRAGFGSDTEMITTLPVPASPPEISGQSQSLTERDNDRDVEPPPPPRFLPRYDSQDLVKQLITKNLEEAQREAISLLQQTEKPPVITSPYYPREFDSAPTTKQPTTAPLYYRSKEAELRKEIMKQQDTPPQTARHQLYQELLKDKIKPGTHKT